jgi:predicted molibdopterin-dependent oxidoreductase YjgC
MTGGNLLETLPDPAGVAVGLGRVGTRIHQDIIVSSMMLVPPKDAVILFPATTRYESPGGGTETSSERRVIFSPEVEGRRIGSAKPEWEVFGEVAALVRPDLEGLRFPSSRSIREEIGSAVPLYAGIEALEKEGDQFQWGGPQLFADGRFATPDGKAHFSPLAERPREAGERLLVSTRRGKQFNSMVQHELDPLSGARRRDVLISAPDAARLHLEEGDPVRLTSAGGAFRGRARIDDIKPGNLAVHWPEGNTLLAPPEVDPVSGEPDYNALVTLEKD